MDYSLLMYIIIRPYSCVKAPVDYVTTRERALFSGALDEIKENDEDSESDEESQKTFKNEEEKHIPNNGEDRYLNLMSDLTFTANNPDQQDPTYVNRKTGQIEILNLFKATSDLLDNSPSRKSENPASPLKNLAYYENRKQDNLTEENVSSHGFGGNKRIQNGSTLYISQSHIDSIK